MARKPADLSGIVQPKGKATSGTAYPGDEGKADAPARYTYEKPGRRSDALHIRVTPDERARFEKIRDATGAPLTQIVIWALEALERDMAREE